MNEYLSPGLLLVGMAIGAGLAWWLMRSRVVVMVEAAVSRSDAAAQAEIAQLKERARNESEARLSAQAALDLLKRQADQWRDELDMARDEAATQTERASRVPALEVQLAEAARASSAAAEASAAESENAARLLAEAQTRLDAERRSSADKLSLLLQAKEALTDQFKSLASDILEEKSKRFAEQNQLSLGQLLDPLKTQLTEFKGKVEEVYVQEGKDRSALAEQVRQLFDMNAALSKDAQNLAQALKGSSKTRGNWGELVLERVLEASGLRKGHEYHVQESQTREDGSRAQPDVVINLPEERRLVVDAKVSLVAYEAHIVAESDEERVLAVRRHLESVRTHVKGLSGKQYHVLYGLKSLDFVLMFVPIEPAFMMAVTHDDSLFMDAWERNVLLVSPSTLLFVVRTVAHLWRQESQSRNAQDIAKRGAELYDKLVGFAEDLQLVGTRLGQVQNAFDSAQRKLSTGKGNVIRQAELLRELGVKPSKPMPAALIENDSESELKELAVGGKASAGRKGGLANGTLSPVAPAQAAAVHSAAHSAAHSATHSVTQAASQSTARSSASAGLKAPVPNEESPQTALLYESLKA